MKQYHEHLEAILKYGSKKDPAREGMPGSLSLFGYQNRYDLSKGFPIVTTKKINFNNIVVELLWFLRGDTNIKYLKDNGCNIWDEDAYNYYKKVGRKHNIPEEDDLSFEEFIKWVKEGNSISLFDDYPKIGDCGKQYGWLWRNWEGNIIQYSNEYSKEEFEIIDQIKNLIEGLKSNPEGRRHIITAWNPATLDDMALNACHAFVQFNCRKLSGDDKIREMLKINPNSTEVFGIPNYYLDCQLYQRSADMFLGVPYNISSYALLTEIVAKICNMIPGDFIHSFGDSHIYDNHIDQVKEQLSRDPDKYELPKLKAHYNLKQGYKNVGVDVFNDLSLQEFELEGYKSYPAIKGKLSTGLK